MITLKDTKSEQDDRCDDNDLMADAEPAMLELAAAGARVLSIEAATNAVTGETGLDITSMNSPGTVIWTDPMSGETRYTKPSDRMYSTALMYAEFVIDRDGNRIEWQ